MSAGLDLIARLFVSRAAIADQVLDKQNEIAALEKIAPVQSLTGWSDPEAVKIGPVGAAQVAKHPALIAENHFGVNAANRGIGLLNFHAGEAADADLPVRFPGSFLERRPNAAQANTLAHHRLSPEFLSGRLKWRARVILLCVADKLDSHSTRFPGQGTRAELLQ